MNIGIIVTSMPKASRFVEVECENSVGPSSYDIKNGIGAVPKYLIQKK